MSSKYAIASLRTSLKAMEKKHAERSAEKNILIAERRVEQDKVDSKADVKLKLDKTVDLLAETADAARENGRLRMEKVVTKGLQSVFGPEFTFEIELTKIGGKPAAIFYVVTTNTDGTVVRNEPQDSRGGGINDIVATAIQAATMVVYNNPVIMGSWLLDEPGKHVSEDYIVKFGEFLEFINKVFKRQMIVVTHQSHLAQTASKTLYSQLVGGKTRITEHVSASLVEDILDDEDSEIEWDD